MTTRPHLQPAIRERAGAMVVFGCYFNVVNTPRIVALAAKHRLPAMYNGRGWVLRQVREQDRMVLLGPQPVLQL